MPIKKSSHFEKIILDYYSRNCMIIPVGNARRVVQMWTNRIVNVVSGNLHAEITVTRQGNTAF